MDKEDIDGSPHLPILTKDERKVVLIQYEKDNPSEDAETVLEEYLKFMYIKVRETSEQQQATARGIKLHLPFAPSKKIDAMWHSHILSTREYFAFCIGM